MRARTWLLAALAATIAAPAAAQSETIEYYGTDAVGSVRIVFNASGAVLARQDYGPFGQEILSASGISPERFGGQTADGEVQQAYFHARQFQNRTGRFAAADPVFGATAEPQRWNRYAYGLNNPIHFVDLGGLSAKTQDGQGYDCGWIKKVSPNDFWCNPPESPTLTMWSSLFPPTGGPRPGRGAGPGSGNAPGDGSGTGTGSSDTGNGASDTDNESGNGTSTSDPPTIVQACAHGAMAYIDGAIPFSDPLASHGLYNPSEPGLSFSNSVGAGVRNFAVAEVFVGGILENVAWSANAGARAGNPIWSAIRSNRYVRIGIAKMGYPYGVPALRVGNASSALGRYLSHVDLRFTKPISVQVASKVTKIVQCATK